MTIIRRTLRGDRNQCPACGEFFNSSAAFAKHRTGEYGKPGMPAARRCLAVDEMLAAGMAKNSTDWWVSAPFEGTFPARTAMLETARDPSDIPT